MYSKNLFLEKLQLVLLDASVVFGSLLMAVWMRHEWGVLSRMGRATTPWSDYLFPAATLTAVFVLLLRYQGLYAAQRSRISEALRIFKAGSLGTMLVLALTFFYRGYSYSRGTVVIFYLLSIGFLVLARNVYRVYREAVLTNRAALRRVLIVGFGRVGQHLGESLLENPSYYHLVGYLDDDPDKLGASLGPAKVLGKTGGLARAVAEHSVHEVIVAIPSAPKQRTMEIVGECIGLRVGWKVVPDLCDMLLDRVHLDFAGGLPLVGLRGSRIMGFNWALKRAFDLAFSVTVLTLASPLFLLIALAVRLSSKGPVLFKQTRIGLRGRPFTFLKFRSMRAHSGGEIHQEYTKRWIYGKSGEPKARSVGAAAVAGTTHKIVNDPRVTAVGRVLRKTSMDELPQFWNVLRGEMSVVGPRPALRYEVERYTEWHKRRLEVLPGITGLWQVSGRNALSFEDMVRLDIQYIESWSIEQDLRIVIKTIPSLLLNKGH